LIGTDNRKTGGRFGAGASYGETKEIAMDFRVRGLDYEPFAPLFELSEDALRAKGTVRRIA